jgi:hypothetical protein
LTATASGTVKWYSSFVGGVPLHEGAAFTTPPLSGPAVYYVENGNPDGRILRVGPADSSQGNGGYKEDEGNIYMKFKTLAPVRFRSINVYASKAGKRHFLLTTDNFADIEDTVVNLPAGASVVSFNWELAANSSYRLVLENTSDSGSVPISGGAEPYINSLYRSRSGITYPQRIDSVITVTGNYFLDANPNSSGGWYIGYDWKVQRLNLCASARIAVRADPHACTISRARSLLGRNKWGVVRKGNRLLIAAGGDQGGQVAIRLFSMHGKAVRIERLPGGASAEVDLRTLPDGAYVVQISRGGRNIFYDLIAGKGHGRIID